MVCIKKMELVQQSGGLSHPKNGVSPPTMRSLITKMQGFCEKVKSWQNNMLELNHQKLQVEDMDSINKHGVN